MSTNSIWVAGLFMSRREAERAVDAVLNAGYRRDDLSVLMGEKAMTRRFAPEDATGNTAQGAGTLPRSSTGAILTGIAATGTALAFPGIDLIVAGPIAAAIVVGSSPRGAASNLVRAIAEAGIPEDRARLYEQGLREGGMVLGVRQKSADHEPRLELWLIRASAERVRAAL